MNNVLKTIFPNLTDEEYTHCESFIKTKCSEYYFAEYLKLTKGNVDDAIAFFKFDEKLRALLLQYLLRFENQIKSEFASEVEDKTNCNSFWSNGLYYLNSAKIMKPNGKASDFAHLRRRITEWMHSSSITVYPGCSNYAAVHSCSFGSFIDLIKYIDIPHKQDFIFRYTSLIPGLLNNFSGSFNTLISYLTCIKKLRDRCAHGGHVVTLSFGILLMPHKKLLREDLKPDSSKKYSMLELTINYLIVYSNCKNELKRRLKKMFENNKEILLRYEHLHSFTRDPIQNLF